MTGAALAGRRHMGRGFAGRLAAVVTTAASAKHLRVIHSRRRIPRDGAVAGIAGIAGCNVGHRFAGRGGAVVAAHTIARHIAVIEVRRGPRRRGVANTTVATGRNMSSRLARCDTAVMTAAAGLAALHAGHGCLESTGFVWEGLGVAVGTLEHADMYLVTEDGVRYPFQLEGDFAWFHPLVAVTAVTGNSKRQLVVVAGAAGLALFHLISVDLAKTLRQGLVFEIDIDQLAVDDDFGRRRTLLSFRLFLFLHFLVVGLNRGVKQTGHGRE